MAGGNDGTEKVEGDQWVNMCDMNFLDNELDYSIFDEYDAIDSQAGTAGMDGRSIFEVFGNKRYHTRYTPKEYMYAGDQNCENCDNKGSLACPMYIDDSMSPVMRETRMERRKEKAILIKGNPVWCAYWQELRPEW